MICSFMARFLTGSQWPLWCRANQLRPQPSTINMLLGKMGKVGGQFAHLITTALQVQKSRRHHDGGLVISRIWADALRCRGLRWAEMGIRQRARQPEMARNALNNDRVNQTSKKTVSFSPWTRMSKREMGRS